MALWTFIITYSIGLGWLIYKECGKSKNTPDKTKKILKELREAAQ